MIYCSQVLILYSVLDVELHLIYHVHWCALSVLLLRKHLKHLRVSNVRNIVLDAGVADLKYCTVRLV